MIPKKIHYIWFGGNPLTPLANKCIASWKKYCPDYEIVRWDESNFDIEQNRYCKEACDAKKWAFASDYARFKILYENGGIYLDTDVELLKPLDEILEKGPFMGLEKDYGGTSRGAVAPGLGLAANPGLGLAANPGLGLYKTFLDSYEHDRFLNEDGTYNLRTVVERATEILEEHGLEGKPGIQHVAGVTVYPSEYFCPKDPTNLRLNLTENSYTIHHFDGSWTTPKERFHKAVAHVIGPKATKVIKKLLGRG